MDRRTVLSGLLGAAGAGASSNWLNHEFVKVGNGSGAAGSRAQPAIRQAALPGVKALTLAQVPLGGGGFVTGIDVSPDGLRLACRTDVANAYVRDRDDSAWRPFFSPSTMLASDYDPLPANNGKADSEGVAAIRIAPSNKDVIYASYRGYIWVSTDGGRSVRRTTLAQKAMPSNSGNQRLVGRTLDVHPRDPRRAVVGTYGEGVSHTSDGGQHWAQAPLPQSTQSLDDYPGIYLVCFDPSASERIYVFVAGIGLHRADSGPGSPFAFVPGGPTFCSTLVAGNDGAIYVCELTKNETGLVWSYRPDKGWIFSKPYREAAVLAVDPHRPERLVIASAYGFFMASDDGGKEFRSVGGADWQDGGEVAWTNSLSTMFPSQIVIDPLSPDNIYVAQGVGVAKAELAGSTAHITDWSAGIEELCIVSLLSPPDGQPIVSAMDKPFWRIETLASYSNDFRYPVRPGRQHDEALVANASYLDVAADNPRFLVGVVTPSEHSAPGFSMDGGHSWQAFAGAPSSGWGNGGCIAVNSSDNIILLPSNNGGGAFTLDGGKSWSPVKLDSQNPTSRFSNAFYVTRKNITADKTRKGCFALVYTVMSGNDYGEPLGGVWLTRDGGRSWVQTLKGVIGPGNHDAKAVRAQGLEERQFWQCQLDYVPGRTSELLYSPHADYAADRFYWSQDDGATWAEPFPAIRNVRTFGFGKAAPGQLRPALYFWGVIDGKEGLYGTLDWFQSTPVLITRFPSQMLAQVSSIAGDPTSFGRVLIGTSCAGVIQADIEF